MLRRYAEARGVRRIEGKMGKSSLSYLFLGDAGSKVTKI